MNILMKMKKQLSLGSLLIKPWIEQETRNRKRGREWENNPWILIQKYLGSVNESPGERVGGRVNPNKHTHNLTIVWLQKILQWCTYSKKNSWVRCVSLWNCQSTGLKSRKPHDPLTIFREFFKKNQSIWNNLSTWNSQKQNKKWKPS